MASLPSSPSKPTASPNIPRWLWASIKPGSTWSPPASTVSPSQWSGQSSMAPTRAIFPPDTATKPRGMVCPSMVWTIPLMISMIGLLRVLL